MGRYSDDDYDTRPPPRRSKSARYRDDDDSDEPKPSRRRPPYAPDAPSSKSLRSPRDYGDPRDVEPRGSGSDRDRKNGKPSRRDPFGGDGDDDYGKSSSRKDKDHPRRKAFDDDDSIAPLPRNRSYKGKDSDMSESLLPRKNEGRRRTNTLDSDDFNALGRRDSKRAGNDDRRDKRPSRYNDDYEDSIVPAKPRRPKDDDRGYRSHDDSRAKHRPTYDNYDDDGYGNKNRRDHGSDRRDPYASSGRSDRDRERERDRDRERGYRSMDEGKRRGDKYRGSNRERDRRDPYDRSDPSYSDRGDRDRPRDRDRDRDRGGAKKGKYGIKFDPESIKGYYETGQKHYKTFKPIIDSISKMYLDSKKG